MGTWVTFFNTQPSGKNMKLFRILMKKIFWLSLALVAATAFAGNYDPVTVPSNFHARQVDLVVHDATRNRDIPVLIYLPTNTAPAPVVLFSHGLGGNRFGSAFLGEHWAARGYVAVFVQHPGSDDSVWKDTAKSRRFQAMKRAASLNNFMLRVKDIPAVLDQLTRWNADQTSALADRLDLKKIGMSGHSFGAVTTEAVSGETFPIEGTELTDSRIKAAIVFSPSTPKGSNVNKAFASVKIPWLLMTGTKDIAPIGGADMKSRLGVYPALQGVPKYEVVLDKAEHSAFTDRALPGDKEPRNPNHHRVILALSTAFWDAYLRDDAAARAWLNGDGPRLVMETADHWQWAPK
jgi:predicted dienelactone hydrolase